jgi:hypothetical protein
MSQSPNVIYSSTYSAVLRLARNGVVVDESRAINNAGIV